jgi:hypothetical protein
MPLTAASAKLLLTATSACASRLSLSESPAARASRPVCHSARAAKPNPSSFALKRISKEGAIFSRRTHSSRWSGLEKPSTRSPMLKTKPCPASRFAA